MASYTLDIIIPSFRLDEAYVVPLLRLKKPNDWIVNKYIVVDNPAVSVSENIAREVDSGGVQILVNAENKGASASRNRGLEAGTGEWILFLDDDISADEDLLLKYTEAVSLFPSEIGFIGMVSLPVPPTPFASALEISGTTMVFGIAEKRDYFTWGATANIMVKRSAVGDIRFSSAFPKFGGGEDVDFFLHVRDRCSKDFKTLPSANVHHPWWNAGKPNFTRPFRYGVGNSFLGQFNPGYTYYDFPNLAETCLLLVLLGGSMMATGSLSMLGFLALVAGIFIAETTALFIQLVKRKSHLTFHVFLFTLQLRIVYQFGLLYGNLSRGRIGGIGERFDDLGKIKGIGFFRFNTYKVVKLIIHMLLFFAFFKLYRSL